MASKLRTLTYTNDYERGTKAVFLKDLASRIEEGMPPTRDMLDGSLSKAVFEVDEEVCEMVGLVSPSLAYEYMPAEHITQDRIDRWLLGCYDSQEIKAMSSLLRAAAADPAIIHCADVDILTVMYEVGDRVPSIFSKMSRRTVESMIHIWTDPFPWEADTKMKLDESLATISAECRLAKICKCSPELLMERLSECEWLVEHLLRAILINPRLLDIAGPKLRKDFEASNPILSECSAIM